MKMLVLSNGTLVDGRGHKPVQKAIVMVKGNLIERVGSRIKYPEDSNVIDLQNLTIMPGLIDCHLHLGGPEEPGVV